MTTQISSLLSTLIGIGAAFVGVSLTIVTLAPALIGIAKTQASDFFSSESSQLKIDRLLRVLTFNLLFLGISVIFGILGLYNNLLCFFWISFYSGLLGLLILLIFGFFIALTILNILKG